LLIKYIKSVLWRVAKRLSYIEDARCLQVKPWATSAITSKLTSPTPLIHPSINCLPWSSREISKVLWIRHMHVLWMRRMRAQDYIWTSFSNSVKAITLIKRTLGERVAKFTFPLLRNIKACATANALSKATHTPDKVLCLISMEKSSLPYLLSCRTYVPTAEFFSRKILKNSRHTF